MKDEVKDIIACASIDEGISFFFFTCRTAYTVQEAGKPGSGSGNKLVSLVLRLCSIRRGCVRRRTEFGPRGG